MAQKKCDELHLFVDETGLLANIGAINPKTREKDVCLVGGVVFWGNFDKFDEQISTVLTDSVKKIYNDGALDELHYFNQAGYDEYGDHKYWEKKNALLDRIGDELRRLLGAERAQGVSIRHKSDLSSDRSSQLSEDENDNRYLFMLQMLIEKLVFSDDALERLTDDAKIVVHVASRKLVLPRDDSRAPELKKRLDRRRESISRISKSYVNKLYKETFDRFEVPRFHSEDNIRDVVAAVHKYRRPNATYRFDSRVDTILYDRRKGLSESGYYLADLFLGQARRRATAPGRDAVPFIVPEYKAWTYEPASEELERCRADGGYFDYLLWLKPEIVSHPQFVDFKRKKAQTLSAKGLRQYWDRLQYEIDAPGSDAFNKAREVFVNVEEITGYRTEEQNREDDEKFPRDAAENRLARAWVRSAVANHSGAVGEGERVWREIEDFERFYRYLDPEKELEFRTETGLRRAVNLLDAFRFAEARRIVKELIERQEEAFCFFKSSKFFKDKTKRRCLGRCYSQLAQIEAASGDLETARRLFERAAEHYDERCDRGDVERNAIYLGHVACDLRRFGVGDRGARLWAQTLENIPTSHAPKSARKLPSLKDLDDSNRYWAPLLLKGVWLFEDKNKLNALLEEWDGSALKESIDRRLKEKKSEHPDGLVLQTTAELRAQIYRVFRTPPYARSTRKAFDDAICALRCNDAPLMDFLAAVAKLRQAIWLLDAKQTDAPRELQAAVDEANASFAVLTSVGKRCKTTSCGAKISSDASNRAGKLSDSELEKLRKQALNIVDRVRFNYY